LARLIEPRWRASSTATCAVRLEQSARSMICYRSWLVTRQVGITMMPPAGLSSRQYVKRNKD
jgi:hypothetical protein